MFIASSQAKALAVVPENSMSFSTVDGETPLSQRRISCSTVSGSELFVTVPTPCIASCFIQASEAFLDLSNTAAFYQKKQPLASHSLSRIVVNHTRAGTVF